MKHRTNQHSADSDEEFLPEPTRFFETSRTKRFNRESRVLQCFRRDLHGCANLWSDRRSAIILEVADAQLPSVILTRPAQGNRGGTRIAIVRTLHDLE